MAGHSKWANIKHKKAREDARRGKLFTKLIREITVAAKLGGGDPSSNPRLRTAIERAKEANMPSENIERAIKRGTGEVEGANYEECTYEGYGPGGVAILLEVLTDNKNRTVPEIRHIFSKYGGSLGESGCVSWIFEKKGLFTFSFDDVDEDFLMEAAIEAGAEDVRAVPEDRLYEVYTDPSSFHRVKEIFDAKGLKYTLAEITMVPKTTVRVTGSDAERVLRLVEALEDHDDVQHAYANFDIPSEEMERLSA